MLFTLAYVNATLQLVLIALGTKAAILKGTFQRAFGIEEMENLILAKFSELSEAGCARLCSRYPGCISFSLEPGLCTLMTAWHNVGREQEGVTFYIMKKVEPACIQEGGRKRKPPI